MILKIAYLISFFFILASCRLRDSPEETSFPKEDTRIDCEKNISNNQWNFFTWADWLTYHKDSDWIIAKKSELRISDDWYFSTVPTIAEWLYKWKKVALCEIIVFSKKWEESRLESFIINNKWNIRSKWGFWWQIFVWNTDLNTAVSLVNASWYASWTLNVIFNLNLN